MWDTYMHIYAYAYDRHACICICIYGFHICMYVFRHRALKQACMSFHIVIMLYFMYIWKKKTEVHKKTKEKEN